MHQFFNGDPDYRIKIWGFGYFSHFFGEKPQKFTFYIFKVIRASCSVSSKKCVKTTFIILNSLWFDFQFILHIIITKNSKNCFKIYVLFSYRKSFKKSNILLSIFGKILKVQGNWQNFNDFWKFFRFKISKDH